MPTRVAQNISLTPEHAAFIADLVASGRYGGASEVVRAALRVFEQQETPRAPSRSAKPGVSRP